MDNTQSDVIRSALDKSAGIVCVITADGLSHWVKGYHYDGSQTPLLSNCKKVLLSGRGPITGPIPRAAIIAAGQAIDGDGAFVIRNTKRPPWVFWSKTDGWVTHDRASLFTAEERNSRAGRDLSKAIDGVWQELF
jgi:hypothetical protein